MPRPEIRNVGHIVITADRGLCGAYNSSVLRAAEGEVEEHREIGRESSVYVVGRKGESYFRYRQIEMLPMIAPAIADALGQARLITVSGGENGGAPNSATNQIASVIQTVLAAQLVSKGGMLGDVVGSNGVAVPPNVSPLAPPSVPPPGTARR